MLSFTLNPQYTSSYIEKMYDDYIAEFTSQKRRKLKNLMDSLYLNDNMKLAFVLNDGHYIGYIIFWEFRKYQYIEHISVTHTNRRKGYGKEIISEMVKVANKPIYLGVAEDTSTNDKEVVNWLQYMNFKILLNYAPIKNDQGANIRLWRLGNGINDNAISDDIQNIVYSSPEKE